MTPTLRFTLVGLLLAAAPGLCEASPAAGVGPWGLVYAHYRPEAFGPERPLSELVRDLPLPVGPDGRIIGARVLVIKAQRRAELWVGETMVKAYRIQLSQRARGTKERVRDMRTPEGEYFVCARKPSKYHRGLWLSYPNLEDAEKGFAAGSIDRTQRDAIAAALDRGECPPQNTKLGGLIMFHGQQASLTRQMRRAPSRRADFQTGDADPRQMATYFDWTAGCIAMFNPDVRELDALLPERAAVTIVADGPVTTPAPKGTLVAGETAPSATPKATADRAKGRSKPRHASTKRSRSGNRAGR